MNRRGFISAVICAPAIVRASSLMPVRAWKPSYLASLIVEYGEYNNTTRLFIVSVSGSSYEPYNGEWVIA